MLGEPEIAVGARGDSRRSAACVGQFDVRDFALGRHPADPVAGRIGEPDCAVGARGDPFGESAGIDLKSFGGAVRGYPSYPVALVLGEPQVAVEARRDCEWRMRAQRSAGGRWCRARNRGGCGPGLRGRGLSRGASLHDRDCGGNSGEFQRAVQCSHRCLRENCSPSIADQISRPGVAYSSSRRRATT